MIAEYFLLKAAFLANKGISKAPGTSAVSILSSAPPLVMLLGLLLRASSVTQSEKNQSLLFQSVVQYYYLSYAP